MVGKEIRKDLRYSDIELPSGVKVSGVVIIANNELHSTNGYITAEYTDKRTFRFRLYRKNDDMLDAFDNEIEAQTEMLADTIGIKEGMDSNAVINEFKAFVKAEIADNMTN